LPDEFARLTGYHRKSAVRLLCVKPVKQAIVYIHGKPEKRRPSNRKGKRIYSDEAISALRLVWAFFWYKCGKILAPLMRQQTPYTARRPAFGITGDAAEKLTRISPASIGRYLKKDKEAMRLTHQTPGFPEKPHPCPYLLLRRGTEKTRVLADRYR
jgi:hypothetical protein